MSSNVSAMPQGNNPLSGVAQDISKGWENTKQRVRSAPQNIRDRVSPNEEKVGEAFGEEEVDLGNLREAIMSRNLRNVFRVLDALEADDEKWRKVESVMKKLGPWGMMALAAFKRRKVIYSTIKVLSIISLLFIGIAAITFLLLFAPFIKLATDLSFGNMVTFMKDNTEYVTCASLDAGDVTSCFINKRIEILQR